jgi:hypothetical protein
VSLVLATSVLAAPMDVAPFGLSLPAGHGLMWEDPREIHRVVIHFQEPPAASDGIRLEYWGSRWPKQRLPKDRQPGGGDVGWMELGNWYKYDWRRADCVVAANGRQCTFTFQPLNAREFPDEKEYPATFRYTLKLRVVSAAPLPPIDHFEVFTDSVLEPRALQLAWARRPARPVEVSAFNGWVEGTEPGRDRRTLVRLRVAANPDPNTFDRTLVTARNGDDVFTVAVDDLAQGALFLPHFGVAVLPADDPRDYAAVAAAQRAAGRQTLHARVSDLPEQTWSAAWKGMPPKKSPIYFPLGLDGGRQRFRLHPDGSTDFRSNDHYLRGRPGRETRRLDLEQPGGRLAFGLPNRPSFRTLAEEGLPIVTTVWDREGLQVQQTAFVTALEGLRSSGPAPEGDTFAVLLLRFQVTNTTPTNAEVNLPLEFSRGPLRLDDQGRAWVGERLRAQLIPIGPARLDTAQPGCTWSLAPGASGELVVKLAYVPLTEPAEQSALASLDFKRELEAATDYWRRRLNQRAVLMTPEPMLNEFYRSHAMHLLVNCEREPGSDRRFARVGSFSYGAYGNESCMMVVDLDRRGYHDEARQCLDAWLHYQGSVALPGDFAGRQGVLYGAGSYEAGGYNQHHGWILWCLAEHYRFTRDRAWLERAAPGIVAGADWILRETARTADRHPLERGLLPAGSLEDIGDWWTWLSTSCYMWRGLDSAAWALEQLGHPEARRVRQGAEAYHASLLANFREAAARSPVVRLRDGTAVPQFPSHVHRRGRSFGWICQTLEGALHLLITRALDPRSPEADWIVNDYEDNLFLSNQYGYTPADFERDWFGLGGMSMQACLLLDVEPYLYRDEPKHALRALFNAQAVSYFPDVRMNTEHALPNVDDWRGDHFKSSDESNCAGWLRYLFLREDGEVLLVGQAVPRDWLKPGQRCGLTRAATHFGPASVTYAGGEREIVAHLEGPQRNPPKTLRLRFRHPDEHRATQVTVNGRRWRRLDGEWVVLPGDIGTATVIARYDHR